jgi:malonyl-CoA O-methyltransferase
MNSPPDRRLDRTSLRRAFNRASSTYDAVCELQDTVRLELLERLQYFALAPRRVLDLGAGTGTGAVALRRRFRSATVIAVDVAEHMLAVARRRGWPWQRPRVVAASAAALPFAPGSFDLVFCSLMLQWCDQPQQVFAEIQRVLRPGGLLQFATFGPATLSELRAAWSTADDTVHVSELPDLPELAAAMTAAGLAEPVLDREPHLRHYASVDALASELRGLGAVNAARSRRRTMTGRRRAARMRAAYEACRAAGGLPASFEIFFGAAFAGKGPRVGTAAEVSIPFTSIGRSRGSEP